MKRRLLFMVDSNPRQSGRVAEAVRIAAGVGVWQKVGVAVYLRGEAVLALGEPSEPLVDEDDLTRYWSILGKAGQPVYVQQNATGLPEIGVAALPFIEISDAQLAILALEYHCVLRF
jgi:hypothetical protein